MSGKECTRQQSAPQRGQQGAAGTGQRSPAGFQSTRPARGTSGKDSESEERKALQAKGEGTC